MKYEQELERIRAQRVRFRPRAALFFAFAIASMLLGALVDSVLVVLVGVALAWGALFVTHVRLWLTKCPRCRKLFFGSWLMFWPFFSKCCHCGLTIPREWGRRERQRG